MTRREASQGLTFRPTLLNVLVATCAGAWCLVLAAAFMHLGSQVNPQTIELMAIAGPQSSRLTHTAPSVAAQPLVAPREVQALSPTFAPQDAAAARIEILEVIEHGPASPSPVESAADVQAEPAAPVYSGPTFDDRPLRKVRTIRMLVTAYSPDARSCGESADGITASGYSVWTNGMALVAADTRILPFHSVVTVPGYNEGQPVPVLDRGGAIKGNRLDLLMPTHEIALRWGAQRLDVDVWEYAD